MAKGKAVERKVPLVIAVVFLAGLGLAFAALPGGGGASGPGGFILLSAGKDGVIGTADDLYVTGRGEVTKGGLNLASLGLGAGDLVPSSRPLNEGVAASIVLTVDRDSAPADGATAITVTAEVLDHYGKPVPDGTEVAFSTTLGVLSASACATEGGVARTALVSSVAGTATVTATCGGAQGSVAVQFQFGEAWTVVASMDVLPTQEKAPWILNGSMGATVVSEGVLRISTPDGTVGYFYRQGENYANVVFEARVKVVFSDDVFQVVMVIDDGSKRAALGMFRDRIVLSPHSSSPLIVYCDMTQWRTVRLVKRGAYMDLYIDGVQVASGYPTRPLTFSPRILFGDGTLGGTKSVSDWDYVAYRLGS